jgi:hypothetical protein
MNMKRIAAVAFILCLGFIGGITLHAQDSMYSNMKTSARQLLEKRNYDSALGVYRDLLHRFPKEPEYQYGTAVCLTMLNREPEEALALFGSVNNNGYNSLSWYYTGLLQHRNYHFPDAVKAYSTFMQKGKSQDINKLEVTRLIDMANTGIKLMQSGQNLQVLDEETIPVSKLEKVADINANGKLIKKPVEFCSKSDLRAEYRPLMYLPVNTGMNDYVYFSGYDKQRKDQKQIFRVKNINPETWGIPEMLGPVINTPYDEEFPYFDKRTSVLYFSSTGHSGMGGYDIFKSVYDPDTRSWSPPENMGFPINSPYDDYLFITDELSQTASFLSNRNTEPGQVTLYKIKLQHDSAIVPPAPPIEIQQASIPIEIQPASIPQAPKNDYNRTLAQALNLQLRADSAGRIVRDKRVLARETPDEEMKKQLVGDIIRLDKESKKLQREADLKFAEARNLNSGHLSTDPYPEPNPALAEPPVAVPPTPGIAQTARKDEFAVLAKSPYSAANPIPKGLKTIPGLIYRIQLGAFSKLRPNDAFGGISPVCFEPVNNTSVLKYYAGIFYSLNGVLAAIGEVKNQGFPDAFIVAYLNGILISTEKAREVEFAGMKF